MSKNPQDRNRVPGQDKSGDQTENMSNKKDVKGMDPKKAPQGDQSRHGQQGQTGPQTWKRDQSQTGAQSGHSHKGDEMNRPRHTDEKMDERKKRPA